jgi:hypothetical protein
LNIEDRAGPSCWGWTVRALACFAIAFALIYLLGDFDVNQAIVQ